MLEVLSMHLRYARRDSVSFFVFLLTAAIFTELITDYIAFVGNIMSDLLRNIPYISVTLFIITWNYLFFFFSGKKKSKFQTFKKLFARKKRKEPQSAGVEDGLKGSQSSDDVSKASENNALTRSEKDKRSGYDHAYFMLSDRCCLGDFWGLAVNRPGGCYRETGKFELLSQILEG